jgi:predicted enzyme related to lactoylglutathione lyase/AraC-like DNA-binding protein
MPATLRHFAINADNVPRAKAFYEKVFGWNFNPWGPPDFYQVKNAATGAWGALQERRELKPGERTNAFEISFSVDDIRTTLAAVEANGGKVASAPVKALEVAPLLRELIVHITAIGMLDPQRPEHDRLAGVLMDLISTAPEIDLMLPLPRDPRALRLAHHLLSSPADKQGLESLVILTGPSLRTLQRCFFEETGMTIEAWRQKARLVHSASALAEGASVTDASLACGYESLSAYIAAFRRQFGVTPKRFRLISNAESDKGP